MNIVGCTFPKAISSSDLNLEEAAMGSVSLYPFEPPGARE